MVCSWRLGAELGLARDVAVEAAAVAEGAAAAAAPDPARWLPLTVMLQGGAGGQWAGP